MNNIAIRKATEADVPVVEGILLDAVNWLNGMGQPLWDVEEVSWSSLSKQYDIGDFYIACTDGAMNGGALNGGATSNNAVNGSELNGGTLSGGALSGSELNVCVSSGGVPAGCMVLVDYDPFY